jgi:hypothetical protein
LLLGQRKCGLVVGLSRRGTQTEIKTKWRVANGFGIQGFPTLYGTTTKEGKVNFEGIGYVAGTAWLAVVAWF